LNLHLKKRRANIVPPDLIDCPDFISIRKEIPAELLNQKKEGLPARISDHGLRPLFNIGGTVNLLNDRPKDSPLFRDNAYERKTSLAASYAIGGLTQTRFVSQEDLPKPKS
jgi:hypothetical protein